MASDLTTGSAGAPTDSYVPQNGSDPVGRPTDPFQQQAALLAFSRLTTAEPPVRILMEDAVAMVAEITGATRVGVGEVSRRNGTLSIKVATVNRQGGLVGSQTSESGLDSGQSMAAYALEQATPVVSADLTVETRFQDHFLSKCGVTSALTVPLHFNGRPFGALGIYDENPREFTPENVQFAETIAHLLTSSIARIRAEEELHEERSFASTVLDLVDTMVLTLDSDGRVVGMNRAAESLTGFALDEIRHKPFWDVFVSPKQLELIRGIFRASKTERTPCEFEGELLTKSQTRRHVSWSMKRMSDGYVQSVILSGVDKSERSDRQAELEKAKRAAQKAAEALKELCEISSGEITPQAATPPAATGGQDQPFEPVGGNAETEQRNTLRRSFRYKQRIAPRPNDALPDRKDFFEVQCNDISAGGISFFMERLPEFEDLVVALGQPPAVSYFSAQVVRIASLSNRGPKLYLVGCRFTGRVQI